MPEPIRSMSVASPPPAEDAPLPDSTSMRPTVSVAVATLPLSELAQGCASKVGGVVIPFLSLAPNPLVAMLVGIKAGSELRDCANDQASEAALRAGIKECLDNGGTPMGVIGNVLSCQVESR